MSYANWFTNVEGGKRLTVESLKRYMTTNPPAASEGAGKQTNEVVALNQIEFNAAVDYGYITQAKH